MRLRSILTEHLGLKLLAVVLAVVLWFMAVGRKTAEVGLTVPLEMVNIPADMVIANQVPDGISLRIRGSVALTRQVADKKLRFSLDLAKAKKGPVSFTLLPDALDLPRGLEVTHLAPRNVIVELERLIVKTIRLLPVIKGEPIAGYVIDDINLEPKQVEIRGPENLVQGLESIWTEPVDVTKLDKSATLLTKPSMPDVSLSPVGNAQIKAEIRIIEKITARPFKDVPVQVTGAVYKFDIHPKNVELLVRGPLNKMSELVAGKELIVKLDLTGLMPGRHERAVVVEAPEKMSVLRVQPNRIKIKITSELLRPDHEP